jgi:hypothetical protein
LVGFGADVYGCVELECNKMSFAHYVSRLAEECFKHQIEFKCRYVIKKIYARRKIVKSAWVRRMLLMVVFEFSFDLLCCA